MTAKTEPAEARQGERPDSDAQSFNWLLGNFVRETDGVRDAITVSSDGLLTAMSDGLNRAGADRLAAVVSGLSALARTASRDYEFDNMKLIMIEMIGGFLLVTAVADGGCIGVIAERGCDVGLVGYQMAVLADRAGSLLSPALVSELRQALQQ
jgi:uncharacterized protein